MKSSSSKVKIHRVSRNSSKRRNQKTFHSALIQNRHGDRIERAQRAISPQQLKEESKISISAQTDVSQHSKFSLINSTQSLKRHHRVDPTEFTLDVFEKPKQKKQRKTTLKGWHVGLCALLSLLLIGGILTAVIFTLTRSKTTTSSSTGTSTMRSSISTTTLPSSCLPSSISCSSPLLFRSQTNNCSASSSTYTFFTCCYRATTNQVTIRFKLQEAVTQWYIDDVSLKQNSQELLINGGFESNITGWTVLLDNNSTVSSFVELNPGASKTGSMYLRSSSALGPDYILQRVNVVQGADVNVSFWWYDEGGVAYTSTDICEGTVILIP